MPIYGIRTQGTGIGHAVCLDKNAKEDITLCGKKVKYYDIGDIENLENECETLCPICKQRLIKMKIQFTG